MTTLRLVVLAHSLPNDEDPADPAQVLGYKPRARRPMRKRPQQARNKARKYYRGHKAHIKQVRKKWYRGVRKNSVFKRKQNARKKR